jgi:hypothetical protein
MLDTVGLISFVVFLILLAVVSYTAIAFGVKNKKLASEVVQLKLDKLSLISRLEKEMDAKESVSLEQTDGFVKFLSESRDWAFKYIEDVQQAIDAVKVSASFGQVSEESLTELFNFLPESNKEK